MLRWLGDSLSGAAGGLGIHKMYHEPRDYLRITTLGPPLHSVAGEPSLSEILADMRADER